MEPLGGEGTGKIPEDLAIAFRVLCNAAKTDKARLQALEVDVARLGQRAENAEKGRVMLQDRLQQLQVKMAKKEKEYNTQLAMQGDRHKSEVAALQHKLSQRGFELVRRQHEMAGLRQQLEEALVRAKRAEDAEAAIWEKHTALAGNLSALLSTSAMTGPCSYGGGFSNILFSPRPNQPTAETDSPGADNTAREPGMFHSCASVSPDCLSLPAPSSCQGLPDTTHAGRQAAAAAAAAVAGPTLMAASGGGSLTPLHTHTTAALQQQAQLALSSEQLVSTQSSHTYSAASPSPSPSPSTAPAPASASAPAAAAAEPDSGALTSQGAAEWVAGSSGNKVGTSAQAGRPVLHAKPDTVTKVPAPDVKSAPATLQVLKVSVPPIKIPKRQQHQQQPQQLNPTERRSLLARLGISPKKLPSTESSALQPAAPVAGGVSQGAVYLQGSILSHQSSEGSGSPGACPRLADSNNSSSSTHTGHQQHRQQQQQQPKGDAAPAGDKQQQQQQQQDAPGGKALGKATRTIPASPRSPASQGALTRCSAKSVATTNTSSTTAAQSTQAQSSSGGAAGTLTLKQRLFCKTGSSSCRTSPGSGALAGVELASTSAKAAPCSSSRSLTHGRRPASSGGRSSSMSGIVTNSIRPFSTYSSKQAAANARTAGSSGGKASLMTWSVSPSKAEGAAFAIGSHSSSIARCSPWGSPKASNKAAASGKPGASATGSRRPRGGGIQAPAGIPATLGQLASAHSLPSCALSTTDSPGSSSCSLGGGKLACFAARMREGDASGALPLAAAPHLSQQQVAAVGNAGPTAMAVYKQLFCTPRQTNESL